MRKTNLTVLTLILLALLFCLPAAAVTRRGDLDGDGRITVNDAIGVLKIVAGWDVKDKFNCDVADVDCDGKIAIGDAILILKYVAGWKDIVLGRK